MVKEEEKQIERGKRKWSITEEVVKEEEKQIERGKMKVIDDRRSG